MAENFYNRTFYNLRISPWQLLNFLFIYFLIPLCIVFDAFLSLIFSSLSQVYLNFIKYRVFMTPLLDYSDRANKKLNTYLNFDSYSFLNLPFHFKIFNFKKINAVCNTEWSIGLPATIKLNKQKYAIKILRSTPINMSLEIITEVFL